MREKNRRGGSVGERGDCVTLLHNTMWMAFSLSVPQTETEGITRESEQDGEDGGFKRVLVLMRAT